MCFVYAVCRRASPHVSASRVIPVPASSCVAVNGHRRGTFEVPAPHIGATMPDPIRVDPQEAASASVSRFGASADDVNAWWNSLEPGRPRPADRRAPAGAGQSQRHPSRCADTINTAVMNDDLPRVEDTASRHGVSVDAVMENPALYGLSNDDIVRYRNAGQSKSGLDHHRGPDPGNPRPVMLWAYEPLAFNGQGRAAIAIGNPDEAENIAVVVPGAGSSVARGWLSSGHNAAINLYDRVRGRAAGRRHVSDRVDGIRRPRQFQRSADRGAVAGTRAAVCAGPRCQRPLGDALRGRLRHT